MRPYAAVECTAGDALAQHLPSPYSYSLPVYVQRSQLDPALRFALLRADEEVARCAPGLCGSGKISLKIDDQPVLPWPKAKSMEINDLDAAAKHRVVIYRAGKPQQSFRFRFSDFKENKACLFLNDLYWTAQLWEPKQAPWCKCK